MRRDEKYYVLNIKRQKASIHGRRRNWSTTQLTPYSPLFEERGKFYSFREDLVLPSSSEEEGRQRDGVVSLVKKKWIRLKQPRQTLLVYDTEDTRHMTVFNHNTITRKHCNTLFNLNT